MADKTIRESEHYKLVVGTSISPEHEGLAVYQIVNKEHGVIETESTILPQIIDWMEDFERMLANPEGKKTINDEITMAQGALLQ